VIAEDTKKAATSVKNAVTGETDARKVDVTLTERNIEMMREIPAGKTAFVVRNNGNERQNFKIEGAGLDKEFMIGVAPNDTKTLNVDLKPGEYKIFVPMSDRKEEPKSHEISLKVK
jgi:iron uptake system EfeUOB component EfeO/EfeM